MPNAGEKSAWDVGAKARASLLVLVKGLHLPEKVSVSWWRWYNGRTRRWIGPRRGAVSVASAVSYSSTTPDFLTQGCLDLHQQSC